MNPVACQQIVLERLKFYSKTYVDMADIAASMSPTVYIAHVADALIIDMVTTLAGKREIVYDVRLPADWWSAVKDRWFPKWLLTRYPPTYRRIKVDKATAFPSIQIPKHSPVVIVSRYDHTYLYGDGE